MGVAAPRAPVGARSLLPPQNFGHGHFFICLLLSRNQVLHKNRGTSTYKLFYANGTYIIIICTMYMSYN